jgi:thiamine transporter
MRRDKVRAIVETSFAVAIAFVLLQIRLYEMPQGGSITLDMLPLAFISYRRGVKYGLFAGLLFAVVNLSYRPFIVHPAQVLLDYFLPPLAFALCGLGKRKDIFVKEFLFFSAVILKFLFHFISGFVFFAKYAPKGMSPYYYSFIYNASYIIPSALICAIFIYVFDKKRYFYVNI